MKWFIMIVVLCVSTAMTTELMAKSQSLQADNTSINKRDTEAGAVTADSQKMNRPDTEVTRQIRLGLMKDDSLSTYAKNIKIITINGVVTIKGPVRSQYDAEVIMKNARASVYGNQIINNMEVISK